MEQDLKKKTQGKMSEVQVREREEIINRLRPNHRANTME